MKLTTLIKRYIINKLCKLIGLIKKGSKYNHGANRRRLVRSNKNLCVSTTAFIFECMLMIINYLHCFSIGQMGCQDNLKIFFSLDILTIIEQPIEKEMRTHIQKLVS